MPPPLPPSQTAALHHTRIGCGPGRQSGHEVARVCDVSGEGGGCGGVGGGQVDLPLLVAHAAGEVPAGAQEEAARAGRQGRGRVRAWGGEAVPWKVQSWCKQYSPEVRQLLAPVLLLLLPPPAGLPTVPRPAPALPPHPCTPTRTRTHLLVVETQTSGSFMRAKVSRGPPKQAAQLGAAGVTQPAASKICAAVLPSQPGTGSV